MSLTLVNFTPSNAAAFTFQPTLDGVQYNASVLWNIFGERYYLLLTDLSGNLIINTAVVSSGPQIPAAFTWSMNLATVVCSAPHNVPPAWIAAISVDTDGTGFDGDFQALAINATSFTYALNADPQEPVPITGSVNFDLNLVAALDIGTLIFREATQQFGYA